MMKSLLVLCVVGVVVGQMNPDPLILSNYLNDPSQGQSLSKVEGINWPYPSYSGYFNVDQQYGSNLFFWFFPAQNNNSDAPLIMWLNGGPGATSMYGLFAENGPFSVNEDLELVARNTTWNQQFHIVYVDQPVGTGWSYTQNSKGFVTNEDEVSKNLYSFLTQFFTIFDNYSKNDFYVCAESYGGKYGPSISYEIIQQNKNAKNKQINFKGLTVGDGLMDPITQIQGFADAWYYLGLLDANERKEGLKYEQRIRDYILQEDYVNAFLVFDQYLNGDFYSYGTFYNNATGLTNYYNFDTPDYPPNPYADYMTQSYVRDAIHVGAGTFWDYNLTVDLNLQGDWMRSVREKLPVILNNYKVMIYNGQYDIILPAPQCEDFLRTLVWNGQDEYLKATKEIWIVGETGTDNDIAGYVRQVKSFTQAVVRQAGHLLPQDQPDRSLDLITNFILDKPFKGKPAQ